MTTAATSAAKTAVTFAILVARNLQSPEREQEDVVRRQSFFDVSTPRRKTTGPTDERPDDCFSLREELANKGARMSRLERELQETRCREAVAERERLVYLKMIADLVASQDVTGGLPQLPLREPDPEQVPETSSEASSRKSSASAPREAPSAEARPVLHGVSLALCEQRPQ